MASLLVMGGSNFRGNFSMYQLHPRRFVPDPPPPPVHVAPKTAPAPAIRLPQSSNTTTTAPHPHLSRETVAVPVSASESVNPPCVSESTYSYFTSPPASGGVGPTAGEASGGYHQQHMPHSASLCSSQALPSAANPRSTADREPVPVPMSNVILRDISNLMTYEGHGPICLSYPSKPPPQTGAACESPDLPEYDGHRFYAVLACQPSHMSGVQNGHNHGTEDYGQIVCVKSPEQRRCYSSPSLSRHSDTSVSITRSAQQSRTLNSRQQHNTHDQTAHTQIGAPDRKRPPPYISNRYSVRKVEASPDPLSSTTAITTILDKYTVRKAKASPQSQPPTTTLLDKYCVRKAKASLHPQPQPTTIPDNYSGEKAEPNPHPRPSVSTSSNPKRSVTFRLTGTAKTDSGCGIHGVSGPCAFCAADGRRFTGLGDHGAGLQGGAGGELAASMPDLRRDTFVTSQHLPPKVSTV